MEDLNWDRFKAKFYGRQREMFENLSYQLFCAEHENQIGIFRFRNQAGFETNPIETKEGFVGFQAKYFEKNIDKNALKDSIKKAKEKNPKAVKIFFYINQEMSPSSKKDENTPKYKIEVEKFAKNLELKVEWRVPSNFERQLALPENHYLAEYFFTEDKSIVHLIQDLNAHTENLLNAINTDILFRGKKIKIRRDEEFKNLKTSLKESKSVILSGVGGIGKTAVIKDLYQDKIEQIPVYVFKAGQFKIESLNTLFKGYGNYQLKDFLEAHKEEKEKIIVIDSAEKLSDIENQEPFREFLTALLTNSWSVIFTTRNSFVHNLMVQFSEVFRLDFSHINLRLISEEQLLKFSEKYGFSLPENQRMKDVLRIPLNLSFYLNSYETIKSDKLLYQDFKKVIWKKKIQNASYRKDGIHIKREKCFLYLIEERIKTESFYLGGKEEDYNFLALLEKDEIIKYENELGKYFITHDIYEEWGLEEFIERKYRARQNYLSFLESLGTSLIIRRAFRKWLSDKLIDQIEDVKGFIEDSFEGLESFWKEEILISILLSEYSAEFFNLFRDEILENESVILSKIVFLLRIGCKRPNDEMAKSLKSIPEIGFEHLFTIPKGKGWENTIQFIANHKEDIPAFLYPQIISLLKDWSDNFKEGQATREAGLLGLYFYEQLKDEGSWRSSKPLSDLVRIIFSAALEIPKELHTIFDKFLDTQYDRREQYFDLCEKVVESNSNCYWVVKVLPKDVIALMYHFWTDKKLKEDPFGGGGIGLEKHYGLNYYRTSDYFPASALQTPIFQLLKTHPYKAINFIVDFTNRAIKRYSESGYDQSIREITLEIDGKSYPQFISFGIWNTYRGTSSPVVPNLLQSIHMALEKYLLDVLESGLDFKIIEKILIDYLLKRTNSGSITAVVTSVILAYPNWFFEVAKILFNCEKLFHFDSQRLLNENQAKTLYSMGAGLNYRNKIYEQERLKTLEDKHREMSLENVILKYQFLRDSDLSEEEFVKRQKEIWTILDDIYEKIPEESNQSEEDKTKRILLTRIDLRKMNPKTEIQDNGILVDFNPTIDENLEKHQKESLENIQQNSNYQALLLWGVSKFDSRTKGNYPQYENDGDLVLKETKDVIEELKENQDYEFWLFNHTIPGFTCAALIRDYSTKSSMRDKEFCEKVIMDFASYPFDSNYRPQTSDGVESSISVLPSLMKEFPKKKDEYLCLLFLTLFNSEDLGNKRICDYAIAAIQKEPVMISEKDIVMLISAVIHYRPIFKTTVENFRKKNGRWQRFSFGDIMEDFLAKNKEDIEGIFANPFLDTEQNLDDTEIRDLELAFQLIPNQTKSKPLLAIAQKIIQKLAKELFIERSFEEDQKMDIYKIRLRFFRKFSYFLLCRESGELKGFNRPFVENFSPNEAGVSFLSEIIYANCYLSKYNEFWIIWEEFYPKIKELAQFNNSRRSEIIHYYLLAWPYWKETAKDWHSLKEQEKSFYKRATKDFGELPATLDSICQILNSIGSEFLNEGVFWISNMINNWHYEELEKNTQYYLERLTRRYVYINRGKIKRDLNTKKMILITLNFLVEKGSVDGYLLREDIL